ncbi:TlpA family protein disulfide reductase [Parapedobacter sp. 10938]|uniref:TlpA family protein disulfide reductase n=1 Tax=Parapedobacter flavus TaxID=3110225 RepID=UPI002DB5FDA6|nr:TlpA disulfide reductase family protein [Parapedobacter sp. 10938]MEC3880074.1 TlpA disulfide reductase family protein [Parapedobacter sp. 10938]
MFPRSLIPTLCLCLLLPFGALAAHSTTVSGKLIGYWGEQLTLNYQEYAVLADLQKQEIVVAADGSFRFSIDISTPARAFMIVETSPVEEQFTVTRGDGRDTTITTQTNRSQLVYLYLAPGNKQHVTVDVKRVQETLHITGRNSAASRYLNEEDWRFNQYRDKHLKNYFGYVNYSPDQYAAYVAQREADRLAFLAQFNKQRRIAKQLYHVSEQTIRNDATMALLLYPSMRSAYREDGFSADAAYYAFLKDVELDRSKADKGIAYYYFLDYYLKQKYRLADTEEDFFDYVKKELSGRPLYEYYAFALASNFKKKIYDHFGPDSPYPDLAKRVKVKYHKLEGMLEGNPAPAVVLQDTTGRDIPLADLKGQYVYIDFWATWCGPCIAEMPALDTLQHDYADANIAFVSISVDKEKDKQKWKDFVAKRELKGVQVWVNAENSRVFTEAFNIMQIPRFVLLDPEGRIVNANAPRPSDKRIRQLLDKVL